MNETDQQCQNADGPSGDEVERLYRAYFEELVRLALRLLDTRHLAEEAVQEAFLRYQTMNTRPQSGCERAYLRTIALNKARSMMRRKQCAERWRPEMPRVGAVVEDTYLAWEADTQLRERCAALPERQRTVLSLRYWHGLSIAEIADQLAISPGSVKTHASRGREALRQQLVIERAA